MNSFEKILQECVERVPAYAGSVRWAAHQKSLDKFHEQESKKGKIVYHASDNKIKLESADDTGFFVSVNPQFCVDFKKFSYIGNKDFGIHSVYFYKFYFKRPLNIFNPMSDKDISEVINTLDESLKKTFEKKCLMIRKNNRFWQYIETPFIYVNVRNSKKFDGYVSFGGISHLTDESSKKVRDLYYKIYNSFEEANNFSLWEPQDVLEIVSEEKQMLSIKDF
jgi:hypothetical protein